MDLFYRTEFVYYSNNRLSIQVKLRVPLRVNFQAAPKVGMQILLLVNADVLSIKVVLDLLKVVPKLHRNYRELKVAYHLKVVPDKIDL